MGASIGTELFPAHSHNWCLKNVCVALGGCSERGAAVQRSGQLPAGAWLGTVAESSYCRTTVPAHPQRELDAKIAVNRSSSQAASSGGLGWGTLRPNRRPLYQFPDTCSKKSPGPRARQDCGRPVGSRISGEGTGDAAWADSDLDFLINA